MSRSVTGQSSFFFFVLGNSCFLQFSCCSFNYLHADVWRAEPRAAQTGSCFAPDHWSTVSVSDLRRLHGSGTSCSGAEDPWEWAKHEALLIEQLYKEWEGPELQLLRPIKELLTLQGSEDVMGHERAPVSQEPPPPPSPPSPGHTAVFGIRLQAPTLGPP